MSPVTEAYLQGVSVKQIMSTFKIRENQVYRKLYLDGHKPSRSACINTFQVKPIKGAKKTECHCCGEMFRPYSFEYQTYSRLCPKCAIGESHGEEYGWPAKQSYDLGVNI